MSRNLLFVVTVDTEADDAWSKPEKTELRNLREIPKFQDICERHGVFPTYLVTHECATRDEALSVLKPIADSNGCEIGHHLHSWTTPPFQKEKHSGVDSAWIHAYQFELPDSLFKEKAECLRDAIEKAYGKSPTSHRAGRWGIDQRTIDWLIENGFTVDSSVVPLRNYSKNTGRIIYGPSFYSSPLGPYLWHGTSIYENDNTSLIEIPITVDIPKRFSERICASYMRRQLSGSVVVDRLFKRLGGGKVLRPNPRYPDGTLSSIVDTVIRQGLPVLNLMLHSSELSLGCSPSSRTKEDCARVWKRLEEVFKYVRRAGITSTSLSGAAALLREKSSGIK